jgi:hypothetical protein
VPPHHLREGRLVGLPREALQPFKIKTPFVHL